MRVMVEIKKKVIPNPDTISYTNTEGIKIREKFELFDLEQVVIQVQEHLDIWLSRINPFADMPQADKFLYYQQFLYVNEKMICNWSYLSKDFPMYQFDIRDLKGYSKYMPILPNKVFLMINSWPDYDEMGISWKEWLAKVDEYLLKNFPEDYQTAEESIDDITQEEVSGMLGACFSRHSYYLTDRERMIIQNTKSYSGMSSRWVKKVFEVRNFDIEDNWLQFEAQAGKRPTPAYKLGSCINPQLDATTGMYQPKLHFLIQDKLKGMFIHWFNRKHIGELQIHTQMISKQDPNKQQYFEEHLIIVPNPEFDDEERAQKLSEQRIKSE